MTAGRSAVNAKELPRLIGIALTLNGSAAPRKVENGYDNAY